MIYTKGSSGCVPALVFLVVGLGLLIRWLNSENVVKAPEPKSYQLKVEQVVLTSDLKLKRHYYYQGYLINQGDPVNIRVVEQGFDGYRGETTLAMFTLKAGESKKVFFHQGIAYYITRKDRQNILRTTWFFDGEGNIRPGTRHSSK